MENFLLTALVSLVVAWLVLLVAFILARPKDLSIREAKRLLPDTIRLLRALAADELAPKSVRRRMYALFVYLAMPFDLVPDFLPVIGYADDVIIVLWTLRRVVHLAGPESLERNWQGSEAGLAALRRLARV